MVGEAHAVQPLRGLRAGLGLGRALAAGAEGDVVQGGKVREEEIVLEDHADRAGLGRRTVQRGAVEAQMTAGERGEPGQRAQRGGLSGTVGPEQRDDVTGRGGQRHVEPEGTALHDETGVEAVAAYGVGHGAGGGAVDVGHDAVIQRSRSPASTAIDTASSTRLSAIAAAGSLCNAR